ncbi:ATP synthase F0 subunit B [Paenibacillus albiflavus]|uniref:ATP synthase subunit b n=1 Tax=Paenibacillus albiflavus TaxID=2545760 RepID=A0A4R4DXI7_9BACL|nr:F0F1 ATP synthase subunit B [Paenibacillus albiflavus]TCZ69368.1 ATP synthase F0 subunit B [Paenibacillus albiflavus]
MKFVFGDAIIAIVGFGILYFLLHRYALGPLMGMMEKRRELITNQIESAQKDRQDAAAFIAEQKEALANVKKEAFEIVESAKANASRQAEEIIEKSRAEADRIKADALRDIESEKNKAIAALHAEVGSLSVAIAAKIIEKQVDEQSQQALVAEYLKEVGGVQ